MPVKPSTAFKPDEERINLIERYLLENIEFF